MGEKIKNSKLDDSRKRTPTALINPSGADISVDSDEFTEIKIDSPEEKPQPIDVVHDNPPTPPQSPSATKIASNSTTSTATTTEIQFSPAVHEITEKNVDFSTKTIDESHSPTSKPSEANSETVYISPQGGFPKPEPPRGLFSNVTISPLPIATEYNNADSGSPLSPLSSPETFTAIGNYIKQRSNSLSAAIARRLSLKENDDGSGLFSSPLKRSWSSSSSEDSHVTEIKISGIKVIVEQREENGEKPNGNGNLRAYPFNPYALCGRVTFYSRSNCRDCGAVRSFLRSYGLNYVEINVDVYKSREKEMLELTGSFTVPQIFFNEKLIGGLVALNSLRNSGELEKRLGELLSAKCPDDAPIAPELGFDEDDDDDAVVKADRMVELFRFLKESLSVQDRLIRMRIVKNCFTGAELVQFLMKALDCNRAKALEIAKELARKHLIHHVFGGNDFQDGNQNYRLVEHEAFIPKCYNFRGSVDEMEPRPAAEIGLRLVKLMFAILESYASEDRHHIDYLAISKSEEFRRYLNLIQGLHRVEISALSRLEKLAFFLNLHNAMVIDAVIRIGHPEGMLDRKSFMSDFQYLIGGQAFSISAIRNGILRSNRRPPYSLAKPFLNGDKRLELAFKSVNPLIHFGLCDGTRSSPAVRFFAAQNVENELRNATKEFFQRDGIEVDLTSRTVRLTRLINWYNADFGEDRDILNWIVSYVDPSNAGRLTHLLRDGGSINVSYLDYDWSLKS